MDLQWLLAIILGGSVIGYILVFFVSELRKTPEQKERESEISHERYRKRKEEEAQKRQETYRRPQNKGCLITMFEYGLWSTLFMIVLIVCVMLIVMTIE